MNGDEPVFSPRSFLLVIDNRDSFVFNLVRYLRELRVPVLVREAECLSVEMVCALEPAGILLSPGPGHPAEAKRCLEVVRQLGGTVPVLGVCLGHQVIAEAFGAKVSEGVSPVHGKNARIIHDGLGVFDGVPSPFSATLYHSLVVREAPVLPEELAVSARTDSGVVMGIRHRTWPIEGVQFHPEAVMTEFGHALLANFARRCGLAVTHEPTFQQAKGSERPTARQVSEKPTFQQAQGTEKPTSQQVQRSKNPSYQVIPMEEAMPGDATARLFRLLSSRVGTVFLDSAKRAADMGTTSYVAWSPFMALHQTQGKTVRVVYTAVGTVLTEETLPMDILAALDNEMDALGRNPETSEAEAMMTFSGGPIGFLGYESWDPVNWLPSVDHMVNLQTIGSDDRPDAWFWFHRAVLVVHHDTGRAELVVRTSLNDAACDREATVQDLPEDTVSIMVDEARVLMRKACRSAEERPVAQTPLTFPPDWATRFHSNFTKPAYLTAVEAMRQHIKAGDIYIANMTQQFSAQTDSPGVVLHDRLRRMNPSLFSAWFPFAAWELISASPERLLQVRNRWVESRPIKGTRPRGATAEQDEACRKELVESDKDKAELLMITDLARNDLSRVCEPGTVTVPALFQVDSLPTVHHLVSTVRGRLASEMRVTDCLRACFPGGSITGAPKIRAMEVIRKLEGVPRGPYTGALGWMDIHGNADFSILIRTMVKREEAVSFGVGGGITWESDPEAEYAETLDKAKALMHVVYNMNEPE